MIRLRKMMMEEFQRRNYSEITTRKYLQFVTEAKRGSRKNAAGSPFPAIDSASCESELRSRVRPCRRHSRSEFLRGIFHKRLLGVAMAVFSPGPGELPIDIDEYACLPCARACLITRKYSGGRSAAATIKASVSEKNRRGMRTDWRPCAESRETSRSKE